MAFEWLIMTHAFLGASAGLAALWAFVELLNVHKENVGRIKIASVISLIAMWISYFFAAAFYIPHYGDDKAIIKSGDWWWAHAFFTESKEHIFFVLLFLSFMVVLVSYRLPIDSDEGAKKLGLKLLITVFVIVAIAEVFGAIMTAGVRVGSGI